MLLTKIREDSRGEHERLEQRLDLFGRVRSRADYANLLGAFYGFYAPLEVELEKGLAGATPEVGFAERRKTHLLERDLRFFGMDPSDLPRASGSVLPVADRPTEALGILYVLEGSTLGGMGISKYFSKSLGLSREEGMLFFNPYPGRLRENWDMFCSELEAYGARCSESERESVAKSATETFRRIGDWLTERLAAPVWEHATLPTSL